MSLDAAAVGTPVVCVDFGDHPQGHAMDHFRPIVESGGVRLAVNLANWSRRSWRTCETGRATTWNVAAW